MNKATPLEKQEKDHPAYRPDIDGLRAFAVLSVVIFHAWPDLLPGGYIGVDVFFVISGFLISTILMKGMDLGSFSFADFYLRRVRRIFPSLIVVSFFTLIFAWGFMYVGEFKTFGKHLAGGMAYVSNFILWMESGYFDDTSTVKPLLHFWSLAIEEQFYIVWPLLLLLATKFNKRLFLIVLCLGGSFLLCAMAMERFPKATFFWPITRFWELLAGVLLAYLSLYSQKFCLTVERHKHILGSVAAIILCTCLFLYNKDMDFPGYVAAAPVLGAFLVIAARQSWFNKILSYKTVVWLGVISYPLYLWHWPLISFSHIMGWADIVIVPFICVAASIVLAHLTYVYIEGPIRRAPPIRYFYWLFGATLMLLAIGIIIHLGLLRPKIDYAEFNHILAAHDDHEYLPLHAETEPHGPLTIYKLKGDREDETFYMGDSNMEQYIPRVERLVNDPNLVTNSAAILIAGGCLPLPEVGRTNLPSCKRLFPLAQNYIDTHKVKRLVIAGLWDPMLFSSNVVYHGHEHGYTNLSDEKTRLHALKMLHQFLENIKAKGIQIYLLNTIPGHVLKMNGPIVSRMELSLHGEESIPYSDYYSPIPIKEAVNPDTKKIIEDVAEKAGIILLDPIPHLCPKAECFVVRDDVIVYRDEGHITKTYSERFVDYIDQTIE